MRHKHKRATKLAPDAQKRSNLMRNLLTSLVLQGSIVTTFRRAKALCAEADSFFAHLVKRSRQEDKAAARRVVINMLKQTLYTDEAGKKVLDEILPLWVQSEKMTGFVQALKLGPRKGDAAEAMVVRLLTE